MGFKKIGEALSIDKIETFNADSPIIDDVVIDDFRKIAHNLKNIAPKAKDFLYFVATIIHAAEASAYDGTGKSKITKSGEPVKVSWDEKWRWITNDPTIRPYKNANGDIFPESELLAHAEEDGEKIPAYKKWVGKPLCVDHKSSSVDHVRGFIVDTYYDHDRKRVIALCALDKINYPDLARKVSTGVSNNVSMGTGVGVAVCMNCQKQATVESDFCTHMRTKTAEGEINLKLNPIELSIVVTPADRLATIKHVIAMKQNIDKYFEARNLKTASSFNFHIDVAQDDNNKKSFSGNSIKTLDELKAEIQKTLEYIDTLSETTHNDESEIDSDIQNSDDSQIAEVDQISPPAARYASEDQYLLQSIASIEAQLRTMQEQLNKFEKEKEMSGKLQNRTAYFQGGGGVNEPTPGEVKYPKEPMNEDVRNHGDKQMQVDDMGGRDGLHPGIKSVPQSELERKKMLARAEIESRELRRRAALGVAETALEAKSYYQGGGDVNEPTLGKRKYPVDPGNEKARKLDKHLHGQKPFPGVGDVDGLHPSPESVSERDELKRKQKLSRAGALKASFYRKADAGESVWQITSDDKVVLSLTVDELTQKNEMLRDSIATREFGQKLVNQVRTAGVSAVKSLFKVAQVPAAPAAPAAEVSPAPTPAGEESGSMGADMPMPDMGGDGDPKEQLQSTLEKCQELISDALEAYRDLTNEKAEMGEVAPMAAAASQRGMHSLRRQLNGELAETFKEVIAELRDSETELTSLSALYSRGITKKANREIIDSTTAYAVSEAKSAIADGFQVIAAFLKYCKLGNELVRSAEEACDTGMDDDMKADDFMADILSKDIKDVDDDLQAVNDMIMDADDSSGEDSSEDDDSDAYDSYSADDSEDSEESDEDEQEADTQFTTPSGGKVTVPDGSKVTASLATRADRVAARQKLAAETLKMNPMLDKAHPEGSVSMDSLTTKSDGFDEFKTLEDTHDAMMDSLSKAKVKKDAEKIHQLISSGQLDESDLDELSAQGVDKTTIEYYKKYWGQADGGGEFAGELVKEHAKAAMEKDLEVYKVKMARAYNLAHKMAARGFCDSTESHIANQVNELMSFADEQFTTLQRIVEAKPIVRKAGVMPQVGVTESVSTGESESLADQLEKAFSSASIGRKLF